MAAPAPPSAAAAAAAAKLRKLPPMATHDDAPFVPELEKRGARVHIYRPGVAPDWVAEEEDGTKERARAVVAFVRRRWRGLTLSLLFPLVYVPDQPTPSDLMQRARRSGCFGRPVRLSALRPFRPSLHAHARTRTRMCRAERHITVQAPRASAG